VQFLSAGDDLSIGKKTIFEAEVENLAAKDGQALFEYLNNTTVDISISVFKC
jgi:hypothetical protein